MNKRLNTHDQPVVVIGLQPVGLFQTELTLIERYRMVFGQCANTVHLF